MGISNTVSEARLGGPSTLIFTVQISGYPRYSGDGSNEHFVAQAIAPNGEALRYRGEGPTLSGALQQLVDSIKPDKHQPGTK